MIERPTKSALTKWNGERAERPLSVLSTFASDYHCAEVGLCVRPLESFIFFDPYGDALGIGNLCQS